MFAYVRVCARARVCVCVLLLFCVCVLCVVCCVRSNMSNPEEKKMTTTYHDDDFADIEYDSDGDEVVFGWAYDPDGLFKFQDVIREVLTVSSPLPPEIRDIILMQSQLSYQERTVQTNTHKEQLRQQFRQIVE